MSKRTYKFEEKKNKKFKKDSNEESYSISISEIETESEESELYTDEIYINLNNSLHNECTNKKEFKLLNNELINICEDLNKNKINLSKILKSNLIKSEKEKAIELYSILLTMNQNTYEYIHLNKLLNNMVNYTIDKHYSSNTNDQIKKIEDQILKETPTIDQIVNSKISEQDKMLAIQTYQTFYQIGLNTYGLYSSEWFHLRKKLIDILSNQIDESDQKQEDLIKNYKNNDNIINVKKKIINLDTAIEIKNKIYNIYLNMINKKDENDKNKLLNKLNWLIELPYNKTISMDIDCNIIYKKLNEKIYGLDYIKEKLLLYINNKKFNSSSQNMLALHGPPGVGKTKLVQILAEVLNLPFAKINFGGNIDSTILLGSNPVWENSSPGMIIQHLFHSNCSNMIILLDELDKLSNSEHGMEVQNALLHILDPSQNKKFNDNYLNDITHDISNIWFIGTLNNIDFLNKPLLDRIEIINVDAYTKDEMINIIQNYTLPSACISCSLNRTDITISLSACYFLLNLLFKDIQKSGMRRIEKIIYDIVLKINFLKNVKTDQLKLSFYLNDFNGFPYIIEKNAIKKLNINDNKIEINDNIKSMYI